MRFETAGSIGSLVILGLLAFTMQPSKHSDVNKAISCGDERAAIAQWTSMNLVRDMRQAGEDRIVVVYDKRWAALAQTTRMNIGYAAFCEIGRSGRGGIVRIDDLNGTELARVVAGKWLSSEPPGH